MSFNYNSVPLGETAAMVALSEHARSRVNAMQSIKTVSIAGAGHSGSTLLGLLLGSHSQAFYMGEGAKVRYLGDEKKSLRKRVCKICGPDCLVWSSFAWRRDGALYAQIARHTQRSMIVDSTKDAAWISARTGECGKGTDRAHLLLLLRDGRAVINSRIRKYRERDPSDLIRNWMDQLESSLALYDAFPGPKRRIRYEELATQPQRVLRGVCAALGVAFEPQMLRFQDFEHHPLGGNNGTQFIAARTRFSDPVRASVSLNARTREYYQSHSGEIELDLRWRDELSAQNARLFEDMAGELNEPIRWNA